MSRLVFGGIAACLVLAACDGETVLSLPGDRAFASLVLAIERGGSLEIHAASSLSGFVVDPEADRLTLLLYDRPLVELGLAPGVIVEDRNAAVTRGLPQFDAAYRGLPWERTSRLDERLVEFRFAGIAAIDCADRGGCFGVAVDLRGGSICSAPCPQPRAVEVPAFFDGPFAPAGPNFLPCPAGWSEVARGPVVVCEPFVHALEPACPVGQVLFYGESECVGLASECPSGAFDPGLADDGSVLFVDPRAPAGGNGTRLRPFPRIDVAIARGVIVGASTIALSADVFTENVVLDAPIDLVGSCLQTELAAVRVTARATIANLSIRAPSDPLRVVSPGDLGLRNVAVIGGGGAAVHVTSGGRLSAREVEISGTAFHGVHVERGAQAELVRINVSGCRESSILVDSVEGGAHVIARDLVSAPGGGGAVHGLRVFPGGSAVVERAFFTGTSYAGVFVSSSTAAISDVSCVGSGAYGIYLQDAKFAGERVFVDGAFAAGIHALYRSEVSLSDVVVRRSSDENGVSIFNGFGVKAQLARVRVEEGGGISFNGGEGGAEDVVSERFDVQESRSIILRRGHFDQGLSFSAVIQGTVEDVAIESPDLAVGSRAALGIDSSTVSFARLSIDPCRAPCVRLDQSVAAISDVALRGAETATIAASLHFSGGSGEISRLSLQGVGLALAAGADVDVLGARISGIPEISVFVDASELLLSDVSIGGTTERAIVVRGGSDATLERVDLRAIAGLGIDVSDGAVLRATSLSIDGISASPSSEFLGSAIRAKASTAISLDRFLLARAAHAAIELEAADISITLHEGIIEANTIGIILPASTDISSLLDRVVYSGNGMSFKRE